MKMRPAMTSLQRLLRYALASLAAVALTGEAETQQNNGVLYVEGTMTESACRLEMNSAWQNVEMGNLSAGTLRYPGDRGTPVAIQLRLEDCLRTPGRLQDPQRGTFSWGSITPAISVGFLSAADPDNRDLVQVVGARGFGLEITNAHRQRIRPGERAVPVLLNARSNSLTYYITPLRTPAPLVSGAWQALINFHLIYY